MFKKKDGNDDKSLPDLSGRLRGFILDSQIQEAHEVSTLLGCSAISDEVAKKEEQESDKRVERISYLFPIVYQYARILSEGAVAYQKSVLQDSQKFPEEVWAFSRTMMEQVAIAAMVGSFAQLVDMQLITVPKKVNQ